jgi:SSS family solute:Na+ symporter
MNSRVSLNNFDLAIFIAYMLMTMAVGFYAARREQKTLKDYFLAGRKLPWYVVGGSLVATVVSTEHFIGSAGASYATGMVVGAFGWNAWLVYSLLIWVFLPYYMRTGLSTMPEFLERRYSPALRVLYTLFLTVGYIFSLVGGVLFAGAEALESLFGMNIYTAIVLLGLATGIYTVYGGMTSVAWTDLFQLILLMFAGVLVVTLGLWKVGGLFQLVTDNPSKFQLFLPPTHKIFPATGVFTGFLSVGIWYNCASQHTVQRCLAARDEWNARMGVVFAGFLHIVMPFIVAVPGIIAFKLFPHLDRPDHAYPTLVASLVPQGLRGFIMAGLAAALMSTLSAVMNSTSTIITYDIFAKLRKRPISEERQVRFGQWVCVAVLAMGIGIACYYGSLKGSFAFLLIQNVFAYIAPPFAVVFTMGILWRRATAAAAMATILSGFPFTYVLERYIFPHVVLLRPYNNYLHRALLAWIFCMLVMIIVSLLTAPPPRERTEGIIWKPAYAPLPPDLQKRYRGWKDFRIWWALFVGIILSLYGFFVWFRFHY